MYNYPSSDLLRNGLCIKILFEKIKIIKIKNKNQE